MTGGVVASTVTMPPRAAAKPSGVAEAALSVEAIELAAASSAARMVAVTVTLALVTARETAEGGTPTRVARAAA